MLIVSLFCHLYFRRLLILNSGTQEANSTSNEGSITSSTLNGKELRAKTARAALE